MTMTSSSPAAEERSGVSGRAGKTAWAWVLATFFGAGLLRLGPGTWGSLAAAAIWFFGLRAAHLTEVHAMAATVAGAALVTLIGIPAATRVERESGRTDPGFVVIDEVAGQWLALTVAPLDWRYGIAAFVLFRIFDIAKPWPARQLEKLHGGTGIMLDDLAAGAYALGVMLLVKRWG
jgi:phosphatidylglycerophosphatase A